MLPKHFPHSHLVLDLGLSPTQKMYFLKSQLAKVGRLISQHEEHRRHYFCLLFVDKSQPTLWFRWVVSTFCPPIMAPDHALFIAF